MASSERVQILTTDQGLDCEEEHLKAVPSEAFDTQIPQSKIKPFTGEKGDDSADQKETEPRLDHDDQPPHQRSDQATHDATHIVHINIEDEHEIETVQHTVTIEEDQVLVEPDTKTRAQGSRTQFPDPHEQHDLSEEECVTVTETLHPQDEQFIPRQENESDEDPEAIEDQNIFERLARHSETNSEDSATAFDTLVRTACGSFKTKAKDHIPEYHTMNDSAGQGSTGSQEIVTVVSHGVSPFIVTTRDASKHNNQELANHRENQRVGELHSVTVTKTGEVHSVPVSNVLEEAIASQNLATLAREAVIQESLVIGAQMVDKRLRDEDEPQSEYDVDGVRKSVRKRKPARPKSPETEAHTVIKKKKPRRPPQAVIVQAQTPTKSNGQPFKCDLCGSPYVTNPSRRGNRPKTSTHQPSPRHKLDPDTGRTLTLCNACGLSFDRPKKQRREKTIADPEEKKKYLEESHQFALSLVEGLGEPDAERLSCPHYKVHACGCLQKYIIGDGDMQESRCRATNLLDLLKEARELSKEKCYDTSEGKTKNGKSRRSKNIGLGNGQRKSKAFEDFIIEKRKYLREELRLCERATQRVLLYSNNFLHKKLKTDPTKPIRVERQKGRAALGKLKPIEDLPQEKCCVDSCVMIALTHIKLLQQWRDRAISGQTEARRVLAEMLTPSGGARSNCYKFISWVTGCSHSTIGRVNEQMKETGGDREPPTHGLIKWWKENPKPKKPKPKPVSQPPMQAETVQQIALQQIQQVLPQVNILQAAVSSAGLTAVMMQPTASSVSQPLTTVNTQQLAQTQFIPAVAFSNGTIQVQATPTGQIQVQPTQQIQVHQQQLQQQQIQYQQQIQQLQFQQFQLQQQQQQLQQQLQQTQQQAQQAAVAAVEIQEIQQQPEQQDSDEQQLAAQEQTVTQEPEQAITVAVTTSSDNVTPTTSSMSPLAAPQAAPLTTEGFLTADALQILTAVQSGQVVTLPVSPQAGVTQTVPVSLIQTPVSQASLP